MGVRSVTGQGLQEALAVLSASRTPRPDVSSGSVSREASAPAGESAPAQAPSVEVPSRAPAPRVMTERAGTQLRVDETTERVVAQIVNEANEVMKQIPPEELLKILARTRELQGLLFDVEA